MWTSFEVKDTLYELLKSMETPISGSVYLDFRPTDSEAEDIVINALPAPRASWQRCTANVNIYVQDIRVRVSDATQLAPNRARLEEIAKDVIAAVDGRSGEDWVCHVVSDHVFANPDGSHMSNVRVTFNKVN